MRKINRFVNFSLVLSVIFFVALFGLFLTKISYAQSTPTLNDPVAKAIMRLFNFFDGISNPFNPNSTSPANPSSANQNSSSGNPQYTPQLSTAVPSADGFTYFPQCFAAYSGYALPNGCTVCSAGCGPSSVAIIAKSLAGANTDPYDMALQYAKLGQHIGCDGSVLRGATAALLQYPELDVREWKTIGEPGSRVDEPSDEGISVAQTFKNYTDQGWTILVGAFFQGNYGLIGHFFVVTKVDKNLNIWAFDPYYGINQSLPFNENSKYPSPYYRYYLLVRKK